jgi:toxin-antitoxin system PIN domain toxin
MIAIDTNLLVYAHIPQSPWNARVHSLLGDLIASGARWAIPVHCLTEFFSIVTNTRIYKPGTSAKDALAQVDEWLAAPAVAVLGEDAATWAIQRDLVLANKIVGPKVHDARIAAVCIQHDVAELWTSDRDFGRFPQLRTRNPLVDPLPTRAGESRARYRVERRGRPPVRTVTTR